LLIGDRILGIGTIGEAISSKSISHPNFCEFRKMGQWQVVFLSRPTTDFTPKANDLYV
jgi:hypothetical protein